MVEVNTYAFGKIAVEDDKILCFEQGIVGFPDLKRFTLIYDIKRGVHAGIKWLQSIDEPDFAMLVMEPVLVCDNYTPMFDRELLEPIGAAQEPENLLMLVTVTVPKDNVEGMTVNLKAPIIINVETRKAVQLITESTEYSSKYAVYDRLKAQKAQNPSAEASGAN